MRSNIDLSLNLKDLIHLEKQTYIWVMNNFSSLPLEITTIPFIYSLYASFFQILNITAATLTLDRENIYVIIHEPSAVVGKKPWKIGPVASYYYKEVLMIDITDNNIFYYFSNDEMVQKNKNYQLAASDQFFIYKNMTQNGTYKSSFVKFGFRLC